MDEIGIIVLVIIVAALQLGILYSIIKSATKSEEQARNSRILIRLFSVYLKRQGVTSEEINEHLH